MVGFGRFYTWWRVMVLLLVVWLVAFLLSVVWTPAAPNDNHLERRVAKAMEDIQVLQQHNAEIGSWLYRTLEDSNSNRDLTLQKLTQKVGMRLLGNKEEPSTVYEVARRKLYNDIRELYFFLNAELRLAKKDPGLSDPHVTRLSNLQEGAIEFKRSLLRSLATVAAEDGYKDWREKESKELSDLVQRRIRYFQNPVDCENSRKFICNLNKPCGFGCQIHNVVYCMIMAYGTGRTLILKSAGWRYNRAGWEQVFLPVSDTCQTSKNDAYAYYSADNANARTILLPAVDALVAPRPQFLPPAIPADLLPRLRRLHGNPVAWWVGQFLTYLLRPQPAVAKILESEKEKLGFTGPRPIVGIHVRRTDKIGTEAQFHSLQEYMNAVDEWFEEQIAQGVSVEKRRVFVASDDPRVITEAKRLYPDYDILGDPDIAKSAAVKTRYTESSLHGLISDIYFLSRCDYIVCTFSSQVCRVAYEIMQTVHVDASSRVRSLDDFFYYGGQNDREWEAAFDHKPRRPEEIEVKAGDAVDVAGNHWNGFSLAKNKRTNLRGLIPSFKVYEKIPAVSFPTYPEVPLRAGEPAPAAVAAAAAAAAAAAHAAPAVSVDPAAAAAEAPAAPVPGEAPAEAADLPGPALV